MVGAEVEEIHWIGPLWSTLCITHSWWRHKVRPNSGTVPRGATKLGRSSRIIFNRGETVGPLFDTWTILGHSGKRCNFKLDRARSQGNAQEGIWFGASSIKPLASGGATATAKKADSCLIAFIPHCLQSLWSSPLHVPMATTSWSGLCSLLGWRAANVFPYAHS